MKVLITGGAGLMGSHIADRLLDAGHEVVIHDGLVYPTHPGGQRPSWTKAQLERGAEFYMRLLADAPHHHAPAFEGVDAMIHCAAFGSITDDRSSHYFDTNVTGYANVLDAAKIAGAPLRRAVVISSQAVYGEGMSRCRVNGGSHFAARARSLAQLDAGMWDMGCCGEAVVSVPSREDSPLTPRSPYAVSKVCLEQMALHLGRERGIDTTILRPSLTYGPRQSPHNPECGIIANFSRRLVAGEPVSIYEDGRQLRDLLHVSDMADAVMAVLGRPDTALARVYNVGTGSGTAVGDVVRILAELWGVTPNVKTGGYRPLDARNMLVDPHRLCGDLGWQPRFDVAAGLADYVSWAREHESYARGGVS